MAEEFFIPKLGQTVEEVTWSTGCRGWRQGQPGPAIMEVETDKAVFPVEANARGVIHIVPINRAMCCRSWPWLPSSASRMTG